MSGFTGKAAFITGAATGFGRAFATALHNQGAGVAVVDIDADGAERTIKELNSTRPSAIAVTCDVADPESVDQAVRTVVETFGGIDILINNAALHLTKYGVPFGSLTHPEIRRLLDVNIMGVINCTLACRPSMQQRGGGSIVNMSSIGGFLTSNAYGVTKLAARGLTIAFATELAPHGIRVNAIAPTLTPTDNALAAYPPEHFKESIDRRQLIKRQATLDDVVNAMLFLCSDNAGFITGETLRVAGGANLSI